MALATLADVKRILDAAPPTGTPRIIIGSDGNISVVDATGYLDAQEAYVIGALGFVPVSSSKLAKEIHANLTAFHIWIHCIDMSVGGGELPEYVRKWESWALATLASIKGGTISLEPEAEPASSITAFGSLIREIVDEEIDLTQFDYQRLSRAPIFPSSERVCTEKRGAGTRYVRNTNYIFNYAQGEIMALATIPDDTTVYVSYVHIEKAPFSKEPERVDASDRSGVTNWDGLFGGDR
jgi:hypothetical protein